jgi:hypothetical protein
MKTPKEILQERHQRMEHKLNAVRRKALASMERPNLLETYRQFAISMRWHIAGLSAVWMVILLLNFNESTPSAGAGKVGKAPPARIILVSLLKNRRELRELTEMPAAIEPPSPPSTTRRSDLHTVTAIV